MANKKQVKEWVEEAKLAFKMTDWIFRFEWKQLRDEDILFLINCNYNNFDGQISVNLPAIRNLPDWYVRRACFHEVGHAFIWELTEMSIERFVNEDQIKDAVERLAERLANVLS